MTELASEIEQAILHHRLTSLNGALPHGEFVMPNYNGYSIANAPA